ncbi:MAG TPA: fasciclin domain-containing protein [Burkholderiaceae bacterium]|nr:fasciclin domain-containing protein [Burkholderiaceae bacterium]
MMLWLKSLFAATLAAGLLTACGGDDDPPPATPPTIAALAQQQNLTALLAAANKAGLSATLANTSVDLTVFAPTNAAFNTLAVRLGFADATALVAALPASALADILSYHVLPTRQSAAQLSSGAATRATSYVYAGSAANLTVGTTGGVTLTDSVLTQATVTTADVAASNGVVHVIDKVLVPPGVLTVVQMAQANPQFSTLVGAVVDAGLAGTLSGAGPFTVFAPTNQAFADIASTVAALTPTQLSTVLTYHVLASQVLAAQIPFGTPVATVSGQSITIQNNPLRVVDTTATPAPIAATDIRASNGVIHVVSKVLIPTL